MAIIALPAKGIIEIPVALAKEATTAVPNFAKTGANAGSKSGQTIVDITGINSGARTEFTLTVSASGALS